MKFVNNIKSKAIALSATAFASTSIFAVAFADTDPAGEKMNDVITSVIGVITQIARWAGILLAVWGVVSYIMALRDEDVEKKHKSTLLIVSGAALAVISFIINPVIDALSDT